MARKAKVKVEAVETTVEAGETTVEAGETTVEAGVETEVQEAVVETEVQEAVVETEVQEAVVETEVQEAVVETEVQEAVVETEVQEAEWIDPVKWIDETPTLEQAMTSLVTTKVMKKVKTVKTGVGQQILLLLAQGELSNKEIVAKVLEDNPARKTTYACVAWYQSQVRAGKIDLPDVTVADTVDEEQEQE